MNGEAEPVRGEVVLPVRALGAWEGRFAVPVKSVVGGLIGRLARGGCSHVGDRSRRGPVPSRPSRRIMDVMSSEQVSRVRGGTSASLRRTSTAAFVGIVGAIGFAACGTTDEASRMTLPPLETTTTTTTTTTTIPRERFYTVQRGDILAVIANERGVTIESIVVLNGLENQDAIQAGQILEIPENRIPLVVDTEP
jgi:LysM repeat protein